MATDPLWFYPTPTVYRSPRAPAKRCTGTTKASAGSWVFAVTLMPDANGSNDPTGDP